MPAGILEIICFASKEKPAAGSMSAAGLEIVFTPDYTIIPPPVW